MKRRIIMVLALAVALWRTTPAQAQIGVYSPPQVNPRAPVSPYLSMFRGSAAMNYYGIVKPRLETARQLGQLQQELNAAAAQQLALPLDQQALGVLDIGTGHPVAFQNTSHYFNSRGGASGVGVAGGVGNPTGRANVGTAPPPIRPIFISGN